MPANGGRQHPKAPRQRNAAPEYIVVSKQLLESKPTVPTVKRVPVRSSGESFADDDLTHRALRHGPFAAKLPATDASRADVAAPRPYAARDRAHAALGGERDAPRRQAAGGPKGGKAADDDVPEPRLSAGPAPHGPLLRRGLAPRGSDVAVLLDGDGRRLRRASSSRPPFCTWAVGTRSAGRR